MFIIAVRGKYYQELEILRILCWRIMARVFREFENVASLLPITPLQSYVSNNNSLFLINSKKKFSYSQILDKIT